MWAIVAQANISLMTRLYFFSTLVSFNLVLPFLNLVLFFNFVLIPRPHLYELSPIHLPFNDFPKSQPPIRGAHYVNFSKDGIVTILEEQADIYYCKTG